MNLPKLVIPRALRWIPDSVTAKTVRGRRPFAEHPLVICVSNRDHAIEKAKEVIAAWDSSYGNRRSVAARAIVDLKTEELIEVLLEQFDGTDKIEKKKLVDIFDEPGSLLERERLALVPEEMVPVAIMREVLHTHRVMFDVSNVSNWKAFVARFGRYILTS